MTELSAVLEQLDAIRREMKASFDAANRRFDAADGRFDGIGRRLDSLQTEVHELKASFEAQPDLRLLMSAVGQIREQMVGYGQDLRMLRSAINDHARENVTPGEIEAIHHDLQNLSKNELDIIIRLRRIEDTLSLPPVDA